MCEEILGKKTSESFNEEKLIDVRKEISDNMGISEEKVADKLNNVIIAQDYIMTEIYGSYLKKIEIMKLGMNEVKMPKKVADNFLTSIELSIVYNILNRISKSDCKESTVDAVKKSLNELRNIKGACGIDSVSSDTDKYNNNSQKFH